MLALLLPAEIERRLEALAEATGRTKTFYAREAILEYLDDAALAGKRMEDLRRGKDRSLTGDEFWDSLDH